MFDGVIPNSDWVRLITVNPAEALALHPYIGRLKAGLKADITILRARDDDANKSPLATSLQDMQMVRIGGLLLYGNRAAVNRLRPDRCESISVRGARMAVCVADAANRVQLGKQTLSSMRTRLLAKFSALAPWRRRAAGSVAYHRRATRFR